MGQYSKKGLYSAYDKNHKEREKDDYYATPPAEVFNILDTMGLICGRDSVILEPCCGGGHMLEGIEKCSLGKIIGTDLHDRGYRNDRFELAYGLDFLADDYPYDEADYVIMNPPFKLIEPFVIRALDIAKIGVLMFGRLQFLEGEGRFNNILKDNPPSDVYVYVDRIACYKNGDFSIKPDSIQAYAWYFWDKVDRPEHPRIHWIRRIDKRTQK